MILLFQMLFPSYDSPDSRELRDLLDTREGYLVIAYIHLTRKIVCLKLRYVLIPAKRNLAACHQTSSLHHYSTLSFPYPVFHFHLSVPNIYRQASDKIELTMYSEVSGSHVLQLIYHL